MFPQDRGGIGDNRVQKVVTLSTQNRHFIITYFKYSERGDEMMIRLFNIVKWFFIFLIFIPLFAYAQAEKPVLSLGPLLEEGIQNNPEILAARQKWQAYKERVPQAGALEDPMVGVGVANLPTNFSFRGEDMTMKEFSLPQK